MAKCNCENTQSKSTDLDLFKLVLSIALTVFLFLFAKAPELGTLIGETFGHIILKKTFVTDVEIQFFLNVFLMVLAIPVQFFCGWSFLKGAVKSIKDKHPNMNLLVSLGTLITFFYSVYITFEPAIINWWLDDTSKLTNNGVSFYETAAMLIAFISFGEYIENRAKGKTNEAVEALIDLFPKKLRVVANVKSDEELDSLFVEGKPFNLQNKSQKDVKVGDYIYVTEGEAIPADAQVILGHGNVDESMLTGESDPVYVSYSKKITAGTKLISGQVIARVIHTNEQSTLSKIIKAVQDAQKSKAPVSRVADRVASVFVPIVIVLGVLTVVGWLLFGGHTFAANLQQGILCAVSLLIVACPCALVLATPITLTVGMGKAAELGIIIRDGSVLENLCKVKNIIFDKTGTLTKSNIDEDVNAAKTLRPDAAITIKELQKVMSINTYMLSGDSKEEALRISSKIGIPQSNVFAEEDPISKKDHLAQLMDSIKKEKRNPGKFAYVGDGINDAPSMAIADVGITLESATDIALESGNVILMHNKLADLVTAIRLSKTGMRKIKQNLFWALFYNIFFIPLAAFGVMLPVACALIHACSSLIVVFNALLLKSFK